MSYDPGQVRGGPGHGERAGSTRADDGPAGRPRPAGPYRPLTQLEIAAAVPPGSMWVRRPKPLLRAFMGQPELADLRPDRARNLTEIWRYLLRWLGGTADGTAMPVRSRLCQDLAVSESTWKRCRRWLEEHGWLGTVRHGYTPDLRAASLAEDAPNEAAVYVLCMPQKFEHSPAADSSVRITDPLRRPPEVTSTSYGSSWEPKPRTRAELAAHIRCHVQVLRQGPVKTLSDKWVAWLARPLIRAGWSPADVGAARDHHPVTGRYRSSWADVAKPGPLLAWRLSRWMTDPDAAWAHWREAGRWPAGVALIPSPSARAWAGGQSVGDQLVARNRAAAAASAATGPPAEAQAIFDRIRSKNRRTT